MFCDPAHPKDYARIPHIQGGFVWASDSHSMVWIHKKHVKHDIKPIHKPRFDDVLPKYTGQEPIIIKVQKMIDFLKRNCRLIDEYKDVEHKCKDCHFEPGVMLCDMGHRHDCTVCEGTGKIKVEEPTGEKVRDPDQAFFDGFTMFSYRQMMRILTAAQVLGLEEIQQKQGAPYDPCAYEMGEFKALMMPLAYGDEPVKNAIHFAHI